MDRLTLVIALLAALSFVGTAQELLYFTDGDERTFEVRPPETKKIKSIVWKFNSDLAAEWSDKPSLDIYAAFKNRATLNTTTGSLVIRRLTKADKGIFSVEINYEERSAKYQTIWIERVKKPEVHLRTLTCSPDSEKCTVTCDGGTEEAKPIQYDWMISSPDWMSLGKDLNITKVDHGGAEFIACRMKNPVSEEASEPFKNPFFHDPSSSGGMVAGIVVFLLLLIIAAVVGALWKFGIWPFNHGQQTEPGNSPGGHDSNPPPKDNPKCNTPTELEPLN